MFALSWEWPHMPRDPAALGGRVSPPWAWCWCLSTEFPALRSRRRCWVQGSGSGVGQTAGLHELRPRRGCSDPRGWGGYGVTPGVSRPGQGCVGQDGACGADST